jgi:membrane protein required for colicin V production
MLPALGDNPVTRYLAAFALIFLVVVIIGSLLGWVLSRAIRAIGLGFVDRLLGAVFGVARGVLIVVIAVLLAGLTTLPRQEWWQNALLAPPLVIAALSLRPWLPQALAQRLDYGPGEVRPWRPAKPGAQVRVFGRGLAAVA